MSIDPFFDEIGEQSLIKTSIVTKYFSAWAAIMISNRKRFGRERIAYFDLFCGPGRYGDGTPSSPLILLEKAVADRDLREQLVAFFIDEDGNHIRNLRKEIKKIPNINLMRHQPSVEIGITDDDVARHFENISLIPSLLFLDPWGYKGLSLTLINSFLKDRGSECIFFFNYRRVNAALDNPKFQQLVYAIFGEQRVLRLRPAIKGLDPEDRESKVMEALRDALTHEFGRFVLWFKFKSKSGTRTSHYLVFVTKHQKGYEIMKEIMAKESLKPDDPVPSFQFAPPGFEQIALFRSGETIEQLAEMLLKEFKGQTLAMSDIYERHNVGRRYIKRNYKQALLELEEKGKIKTEPTKRRQGSFADHVKVRFP